MCLMKRISYPCKSNSCQDIFILTHCRYTDLSDNTPMERTDIDILIPHRGTLKLIERVTVIEEPVTVSSAVVNDQWPLFAEGFVDTLICIELIAQTAAAHIYLSKQPKVKNDARSGWLAGLREAQFYIDRLKLGDTVETRVTVKGNFGTYSEIAGSVYVDKTQVCEAVLQVVEA